MAEDENYKAQLSIKFGHANQHMLNVRGATMAELTEEIDAQGMVVLATVEEFMAKAAVVNAFPGTQKVDPPFTGGTPAPAATTPVNDGVKRCAHQAPMKFQEGTTKAGKPYKGWFCQVENDPTMAKCAPQWLN